MIVEEVGRYSIVLSKKECEELMVFIDEGITHTENTRPSELSYPNAKTNVARELKSKLLGINK